jgi:hypothetical protein
MSLNEAQLRDLVAFIVSEARDRGAELGVTRLTKLLYLADVGHFAAYRERLTDFDWVFLHYGPYAYELPVLLRRLEFDVPQEEVTTAGGLRAHVFRPPQVPEVDLDRSLGGRAARSVRRVLDRWLETDMNELLSHVYFHTEPMKSAHRRRERLDFRSVPPEVTDALRASQRELDAAVVATLRERTSAALARRQERAMVQATELDPKPRFDATYYSAMNLVEPTPAVEEDTQVESDEGTLDSFGRPTERH